MSQKSKPGPTVETLPTAAAWFQSFPNQSLLACFVRFLIPSSVFDLFCILSPASCRWSTSKNVFWMWHQSAPRAPVRFNLSRWVLCFKACINLISPTGCSVLWFFIIKMSTEVLQRLSTIALSTKHLRRLPHLSDFLPFSLPPPSPTVTASQVPSLFREPYILSGYRPVQQDWRCYLLSLFRKHNESLNVWTHLLAGPVLLLRWWANVDTLGCTLDDVTSLPLLLFLVSSLTYLYLSVAAHLLQSHSERAHYYFFFFFFFLDYVGVACISMGARSATISTRLSQRGENALG